MDASQLNGVPGTPTALGYVARCRQRAVVMNGSATFPYHQYGS
jgi:hypothetical protein